MRRNILNLSQLCEIILFTIVALLTIHPATTNYDFWFHTKYGEYILQTHSLPFTDVFSHTAFGQPAIPYEWLFQVALYLIFQTFGAVGVQVLVGVCLLLYLFLFRQILKEFFNISLIPRIFLVGLLSFLTFEFWVERPQIVAYLLFMATLYLVLKRVYLNKSEIRNPKSETNTNDKNSNFDIVSKFVLRASNLSNSLWLTIPIFFVWTNLHASMILGLYLFFSFALLLLLRYLFMRDRADLIAARDLIIFGGINIIVTILPPLGINVYKLLWLFFEKRDFITTVITEWVPLSVVTTRFYTYLAIMAVVGLSYLFALFKNSKKTAMLLFLPLIPLGLFVLTGIRQTPFAMPALIIVAVPFIQMFTLSLKPTVKNTIAFSLTALIVGTIFFYRSTEPRIDSSFPKGAIPFIKYHLAGNMFNEFQMGGYLMYHLGPEIKTFIDGRTDMFLPVVLPQYNEAFNRIYKEDSEFLNYFMRLVDEYHVSWAILSTNRYSLPLRRLTRLLRQDPHWHLVFFDDTAEIYVWDDGKNNETVKEFAISAATPFSKKLYKQDKREGARVEYEKMQNLSKSAVAINALGFMLLEDGKFGEAKKKFDEALQINPTASAPKMNLAELAAADGNFQDAISLYRQAIKDDPERGLAYLRLGQLIIQSDGSKEEAKKVWQEGLGSTPDEEILARLRKELERY